MQLDSLIREKAQLISYTQDEISNIAGSSNHLRQIIHNQPDFRQSFLGGSYLRKTMVKSVSDVDVYYEYTGSGNPQSALTRLKNCLVDRYPNSIIKQDKPSILVDFNLLPFNITPCRISPSNTVSIPDARLLYWQQINPGRLEEQVKELRRINPQLIELIKILKLWRHSYKKPLRNFEIEDKVYRQFRNKISNSLSDWIYDFLANNNFQRDANRFNGLMVQRPIGKQELKTRWLDFIENR